QNSCLQGFFEWRPNSTEQDNGGTVIAPSPALPKGRWHRVFEGAISVKWFGAKGDGNADDTTAIQGAIDALPADKGGFVYFPSGTYKITATLTHNTDGVAGDLKPGVALMGDGRYASVIVTYAANSYAIQIKSTAGFAFQAGIRIESLGIVKGVSA